MIAYFTSHSQDTSKIIITSDQLRTTNLIFAEHKAYSKLIPVLEDEIYNLELINETWMRTDSIKTLQLKQKNQIIAQQNVNIDMIKKSTDNQKTIFGTIAGASIIATILCLLLK